MTSISISFLPKVLLHRILKIFQDPRSIKRYSLNMIQEKVSSSNAKGFSELRCHLLWALQAPISLENRCGLKMMVEQRNRQREGIDPL